MDRWRISSIDMDAGNLLLVKCSQTLSSWIKKSSSLFLQIRVRYLRICFCLKRVKSWLEFSIKSIFSQYSMRSFQRSLVGFNNLESILFLENLIECLCLKCPRSVYVSGKSDFFFYCFGQNCIFTFQFPFRNTLE